MKPIPTLMACTLLFATAAGSTTELPRQLSFHGVADVGADGRIDVRRIEGVDGALAAAVRSQLEARRATPAQREGHAVATSSPFSGSVALTVRGEQTDVAVDRFALQPAAVKYAAISYPVESMRSERAGWVEVQFTLDGAGAPIGIEVVEASHPDFGKAVRNALPKWRFATDAVEPGRRLRVTATFQAHDNRATPAFACPLDTAYAHVDGQDGCADTVSVHGSVVVRRAGL